jgi:hypothetical protein
MLDVPLGTGTSKHASNVLIIGFSIIMVSASQSQINVLPLITLVPAYLAIKDIT